MLPVVMVPPGSVASCVNDGARRNAARTEGVVESHEGLPIHCLIDQSHAAAQHCLPVATDVPGKTETGAEIFVVGFVEAADLLCRSSPAPIQGSDRNCREVVIFFKNRAVLVTHAQVHRQILR